MLLVKELQLKLESGFWYTQETKNLQKRGERMRYGHDHQRVNVNRALESEGLNERERSKEQSERGSIEPGNTIITKKESKWKKVFARFFSKDKR